MNLKYNLLQIALITSTTSMAIAISSLKPNQVFAQSIPLPSDRIVLIASENTLPIEVQSAVIEAAAGQTSRTVADLKILSSQAKNWPDSCLGFSQPGEVCAQALTSGWQVVVTDGLRNWTYRTDDAGDLIKLEPTEE